MVIFGRSVFYLFSRLVNNSDVRFYIFLAVWIRPYVEVRLLSLLEHMAKNSQGRFYSWRIAHDNATKLNMYMIVDQGHTVGIWYQTNLGLE